MRIENDLFILFTTLIEHQRNRRSIHAYYKAGPMRNPTPSNLKHINSDQEGQTAIVELIDGDLDKTK